MEEICHSGPLTGWVRNLFIFHLWSQQEKAILHPIVEAFRRKVENLRSLVDNRRSLVEFPRHLVEFPPRFVEGPRRFVEVPRRAVSWKS